MSSKAPTWRQVYFNVTSIPFWGGHILALALLVTVPWSWTALLATAVTYFTGMFFVTAVYHRYFAHRAFKTSRAFQFILAFITQITSMKGVLWWASNHRHHHRYSDMPEDAHSVAQRGFLWAHLGWFLGDEFRSSELDRIRDFARYPELRLLNHPLVMFIPAILYATIVFLVGGWFGFAYAAWVPLVLIWHGTFTINSLAHVFGHRRYPTPDESKNNLSLALLTMGEGWHNNHHHYQRSCRQGFRWYEIDVTYYILRLLAVFGLIWDIAEPPRHVVEDRPNDKALELASDCAPAPPGVVVAQTERPAA